MPLYSLNIHFNNIVDNSMHVCKTMYMCNTIDSKTVND